MTSSQISATADSLTVAPRSPRLWVVDDLLDNETWRVRFRRFFFCTSSTTFADIGSDFFKWYRQFWLRKQLGRILLSILVLTCSFALNGLRWQSSLVLVPTVLALASQIGVATVAAIPIAFCAGPYWWMPFISVLAGGLYSHSIEPSWEVSSSLSSYKPISFLPFSEQLRLAAHRARFAFASALDLAVAGFPERAIVNIEATFPILGERTPNALAMLSVVQALTTYEQGEHADVLQAIERARQLSEAAAPSSRAWGLARLAQLLELLGDSEGSLALNHEALRCCPKRNRPLRIEIYLQRARQLANAGNPSEGLKYLHLARLASVRDRDLLGIMATELALLDVQDIQLNVQSDVLSWLVDFGRANYRNAVPIPGEVVGAIEARAAKTSIAMNELQDAADHFVRSIEAFENRNPIQKGLVLSDFADMLTESANTPIQDGMSPTAQKADALEAVLLAIRELNNVRYSLPTVQWRQRWTLARSRTYDMALRLALELNRLELAASLIELSKFQGVPLGRHAGDNENRQLLDSFLETRTRLVEADLPPSSSPQVGDSIAALLKAHPVGPSFTPIVSGTKVFEDVDDPGLDIDAVVTSVAGLSANYLTAVITGQTYYWAWRTSQGGWLAGRVNVGPHDDAGILLDELFSMLPIRRPSETATEYAIRLSRSPLFSPPSEDVCQSISSLFQAVGRYLIPAQLVAELRKYCDSGDGPPMLLISMSGVLASLPIEFLGVSHSFQPGDPDDRLIDIAKVSWLPSIQLALGVSDRLPADSWEWPVRVAGVFPVPGAEKVAAPPLADRVIDTGLPPEERKRALLEVLASVVGMPTTAYLSGHLASAEQRGSADPLDTGLQLAVEDCGPASFLTVGDILNGLPDHDSFLPERLLLLACSTAGVIGSSSKSLHSDDERWPLSGEWTGFGAACLVSGARTIVCTHFDQLDSSETTRLDHRVASMLANAMDPVAGLGIIQREALEAWRRRESSTPAVVPMVYTIVAC